MTPAEAKAVFLPRLSGKYMALADKVQFVQAYANLSNADKQRLQRAFESGNIQKTAKFLQSARKSLADSLANARIDEILADGSIDLGTEIDELL